MALGKEQLTSADHSRGHPTHSYMSTHVPQQMVRYNISSGTDGLLENVRMHQWVFQWYSERPVSLLEVTTFRMSNLCERAGLQRSPAKTRTPLRKAPELQLDRRLRPLEWTQTQWYPFNIISIDAGTFKVAKVESRPSRPQLNVCLTTKTPNLALNSLDP